jgi:hypothetical protein
MVAWYAVVVAALTVPGAASAAGHFRLGPAEDPRLPVINAGYANRPIEPTHFSPNDIYETFSSTYWNSYVSDITWSSWGGDQASALAKSVGSNGTARPARWPSP